LRLTIARRALPPGTAGLEGAAAALSAAAFSARNYPPRLAAINSTKVQVSARVAAERAPGGGAERYAARVDDRRQRVAALLHEAGETHHIVYRIVDGEDPDWASWYADWLVAHSELPEILGSRPVRSELVWLLVQLDKHYVKESPEAAWPDWYAQRILDDLG
jgi:hypothetical protein